MHLITLAEANKLHVYELCMTLENLVCSPTEGLHTPLRHTQIAAGTDQCPEVSGGRLHVGRVGLLILIKPSRTSVR
jgi:hypothetical protein